MATTVAAENQPDTVNKPIAFYLGAGLTLPASPASFRNDHSAGINIYTALGYSVSPYTEITGRLELHTVSLDTDTRFGDYIEFSGGGIDILLIGADVRFSTLRPAVTIRPFVTFGCGVSRLSQGNITTNLSFEQYAWLLFENQTKLYFSLGVGFDFKPVANTTMFLLVRYVSVSQDADNKIFLPITLGFKF
jgi:hypothetical protein